MSYIVDPKKPLIVIVGAGIGGIASGIAIQKDLGHENFLIFEKALEVGGTWRENTYPGCGCDVPSHWYSISSDPNPNWSTTFSPQPEILEYLKDVTTRNSLRSHLRLGHKLITAKWNDTQQQYLCSFEKTNKSDGTKETVTYKAQVLINCTGGLHVPKLPDIKGFSSFAGDTFHSAQWRHDIPLSNKTIGIIGNGCSSCQIVPVISQDPSVKVINFCRTPAWFAPRYQMKYPAWLMWVFTYVPFVHMLFRFFIYLTSDLQFIVWVKSSGLLRKGVESYMKSYIRSKAPKHMIDELTPQYSFGCKRVIRDPGYLESLHRPNVSITWSTIQEVVSEGIVTSDGTRHKLDILIPATGFDTTSTSAPPIIGQGGKSMEEYFNEQGGPTAYLGSTMPGFPNCFSVLGPNIASGHASAIFVEESAIHYFCRMIKPIIRGDISSVDVKESATEKYNENLQRKIGDTVWSSCSSYYNQNGGKNVAMYPGFATSLMLKQYSPKWADYTIQKVGHTIGYANGNGKAHHITKDNGLRQRG